MTEFIGQNVPLESLPSKGKPYPDDIEIYVKPLTIKEQMEMDTYGVTTAEYFNVLLRGITVRGAFDKRELLFHDVQFLDLVRRLFTFDTEQEIQVKDVICQDCGHTFNGAFKFNQIEFTDFTEDAFEQRYTFSDGLTITCQPMTIGKFIRAGRKYFSTKKLNVADIYLGYFVLCVTNVEGREFKNEEAMQDFLYDYFGNLYMAKDKKILDELDEKSASVIVPLKLTCPKCGEIVEVAVNPSYQFQQ